MLLGEGTSAEPVTVALLVGRLVEFGDRALAPHPDSDPAETATVEAGTSSPWRKRLVASSSSASSSSASSSSEEEEEGMLHYRRHCFAAENLLAAAFGDVRGKALDAPPACC